MGDKGGVHFLLAVFSFDPLVEVCGKRFPEFMNPRTLNFPNGLETVKDIAVGVDFDLDITAIHVARFRGESNKEGAEACNVVPSLIPAPIVRFDPKVGVVDVDVDLLFCSEVSLFGGDGWLRAAGTLRPRAGCCHLTVMFGFL